MSALPKLVSFTICPYVQRAAFTLEEKGQAYEIEYIDIQDKPAWFLEISPRGKVPLLLLPDGAVLFESQGIVEYLDETLGERLAAEDPVLRARERAWFAFAGEDLFGALHSVMFATTAEGLEASSAKVRTLLGRLESEMQGRQWLSNDGSRFGLADVALLPAFTRIAFFEGMGAKLLNDLPTVAGWSARMLARPAAARSIPPIWEDDMRRRMAGKGAVLATG